MVSKERQHSSKHSEPRLKVLLVAYDFAPLASPQSLRWIYLARELHRSGVEVSVLTARHFGNNEGLPDLPSTLRIHRVFAGPFFGGLNWVMARRSRRSATDAPQTPRPASPARAPVQGKGRRRMVEALRAWWSLLWFPDARGEWVMAGVPAVRRLLRDERPDVVIGSHEPAVSLLVAMQAQRFGVPWIADMGDPVDAPYTQERWKVRAKRTETAVCRNASLVVVTSEATRQLLLERHAIDPRKIDVVTQGFTEAKRADSPGAGHTLTLLYSGRFYNFRDPGPLLKAVGMVEGVRLVVMGDLSEADRNRLGSLPPEKQSYLGNLPHSRALEAQRESDVLVNIGNLSAAQVPGKIYEYLGSGRPILQIAQEQADAGSELIAACRRGWVVNQDSTAIAAQLRQLVELKRAGRLDEACSLDTEDVRQYSWAALAATYENLLKRVTARDGADHGRDFE